MKSNKIYPFSMLRLFWLFIWLFFIFICGGSIIFIIVENQYTLYRILCLTVSILGLIICLLIFCFDLRRGIIFENDRIRVESDLADKNGLILRRFQHKIDVTYTEVQNIFLTASNRDSRGREVKNVFVNMPYIIFECKNGSQKAINVYYYSKRQVIRIIDEFIQRAHEKGNFLCVNSGKKLLEDFLKDKK